jgi:cysteine desulfurase
VLKDSNKRVIVSHSGILCTITAYYTDFTVFFKRFFQNNRIYLDYASSTPVDQKMISNFPLIDKSIAGANPSALHREGVLLRKALSSARGLSAKAIGAHADEIVFTSNASESDNLALLGSVKYFLEKGIYPSDIVVYTSPFEHSAVKESLAYLQSEILVCVLPQENGIVSVKNIVVPKEFKVLILTVMFVQNEIGTVQPIKDIAKQVRKLRKEYPESTIVFHTDATQTPLFYDLNVARLGVDMMTLGATKLYCPKGVGMLYKRRGVNLLPIFYGGGQEMGLRPGTQAVELIHNFAHALDFAQSNREKEFERTRLLQYYFESKVEKFFPFVRITKGERTPHISHLVIPNIDSELLVIELDARGIAVSSKSACKNEEDQESELVSMLYPDENLGAIRISYGRKTTRRELDKTIKSLSSIFKKYNII